MMSSALVSASGFPLYGVPITIGVTGHRNLRDPEKVREVLRQQMEVIQSHFHSSPLHALSALAEGADCLFAEVALEVGWELHVVLPLKVKTYEVDFSEQGAKIFHDLKDRA